MNGLSVGGCIFGMVIWADCFGLLERGFLGKIVGTDVLMDVLIVKPLIYYKTILTYNLFENIIWKYTVYRFYVVHFLDTFIATLNL